MDKNSPKKNCISYWLNNLQNLKTIENYLQKRAIKNYISMQKGDVLSTLSDTKLLR